jgi:hypothetical protein
MAKYKDVPPVIRRVLSMRDEIEYHLMREKRTLQQEFILILKKESKLPKRLRDYIIHFYDENDQTQQTENPTDVSNHGNDELHPGE